MALEAQGPLLHECGRETKFAMSEPLDVCEIEVLNFDFNLW